MSILLVVSWAVFVWMEYRYFRDQAISHHERPPGFWAAQHMHDLWYNAAANWQSELMFGVFLVVVLNKLEGRRGESET